MDTTKSPDRLSPEDARIPRSRTPSPAGSAASKASSHLELRNVSLDLKGDDIAAMCARGHVVRKEMAERLKTGNWRGFGQPIFDRNGHVLSIRLIRNPDHPEDPTKDRTEDFRCLLQLAKTEMDDGNTVLLRNREGYDGCTLYVNPYDHGCSGLGTSPTGAMISVYSVPLAKANTAGLTPKEAAQRMPDLQRSAVLDGGAFYLACLAHLITYYMRSGFALDGTVPSPPVISTPGWTKEDDEKNAAAREKWTITYPDGSTIPLPLAIMMLEPAKFADFNDSADNKVKGTPKGKEALNALIATLVAQIPEKTIYRDAVHGYETLTPLRPQDLESNRAEFRKGHERYTRHHGAFRMQPNSRILGDSPSQVQGESSRAAA